jgi:transposase
MDMIDSPGNLRLDELCDEQTKLKYHYITRNEIFKHIWNGEGDIAKEDLEYIKATFPVIKILKECLYQFRSIFEKKTKESLTDYIKAYKDCELKPVRKFVEGLQKDIISVTNAVVEEYSNGFVEGTNNKLKMMKRVCYGRCKLPLLRSKLLLDAFFWP